MIRPHLRLLCGLLALAALIGLVAPAHSQAPRPTAQPTEISFFGLNTYFTGLERNGRDGDAGVATLIGRGRQIGAAWAREELSWGNLERDGKGRWSWGHFDRRLLATAEAGYGIVGMLLTTPAWARVGDCAERIARFAGAGVRAEDYWCPPANPQDFADYVRAVVERYDADGQSDAPGSPRVAAWQIWNEPNAWETWPGSPAEFAAILEAGYDAAKAADPSASVALGGLYLLDGQWRDDVGHSDGLRFLDAALSARPAIWSRFDALAIHPYMPDVAPDQPGLYGTVTLWGRIDTARAWLEERALRLGGPPRPLWISEVGWSTCAASEADCYAGPAGLASASAPATPPWRLTLGPSAARSYGAAEADRAAPAALQALIGKSEEQQASYLVRAHGVALARGVSHLSWFQLEDKFDGSARNFWEEAAILRSAAQGYALKPAASAYATLVNLLGAAAYSGPGPLHSFTPVRNGPTPVGRFDFRFLSADNRIVDLLWRNAGAEAVALPLEPGRSVELFGRDGQPLPLRIEGGAARFTIGEAPVYLRQSVPPALSLRPTELVAVAAPADRPVPFDVTLTNLGSGLISWGARSTVAWATVAPASGQGRSGRLRVILSPAGLTPGVYQGALRIETSIGTRELPLRLVILERPYRLYLPLAGQPN